MPKVMRNPGPPLGGKRSRAGASGIAGEKGLRPIPAFLRPVIADFEKEFPGATINLVRRRGVCEWKYGMVLLFDGFENVPGSKRQAKVWGIVSRHLSADDSMRLGVIYAMTQAEREGYA